MDDGLLDWFVLQVDLWLTSCWWNLLNLGIIRLLWFLEKDVNEGSLTGLGLESGLDQLLDLVIGNLDVHDLLLASSSTQPKNVFTP
jgi:hypothetical protein